MLQLWPLTIHRYGLMYLFGILIGWGILWWLGRQVRFQQLAWSKVTHVLQHQLDDLITYIVAWIIVWGRLWHVLIYDPSYYATHLIEVVQIWKWGMSFVWWFIGVWLSVWYRVRRAKLTVREFFILTDLVVLVLPIGIALWRLGNAINQELVWRTLESYDAWKLGSYEWLQKFHLVRIYDSVDMQLRWNTNLFEWISEGVLWFVVTAILLVIQKAKRLWSPWLITGGFMMFYAIVRFILESMRDNPLSEYIILVGQQINKTQIWMVGFMILGMMIVCKSKKLWKL